MPAGLSALRMPQSLSRWWAAKRSGERRIVVLLALAASLIGGWFALWQPLNRDLAAMRAEAPVERNARAAAQRMADDLAGLARSPSTRPAPDARAELERILTARGLRTAVTQIDWQDARVRITFANVRFERGDQRIEALQREAQLRVIDAALTARVDPGTVRAELVLNR